MIVKNVKSGVKMKKIRIDIIYYIVISFFALFFILNTGLGYMDELFNFMGARNIAFGLLPYKDFNIISTPLSFFVNSLVLLIKPTLFVFRILFFIYYLVIIFLLDKIIKLLKVSLFFKYFSVFIISYLLLSGYLDYNFIQLILILLLIYLSLKNINYKDKKLNIVIPIIAGFTVINKQSTGLMICFVTIFLMFLNDKKNWKFILKEIGFMLIPIVLFLIYLLLSDSLFYFFDLSILGITTFSNKFINHFCAIVLISAYISMTILLILYKERKFTILYWYAIASLFVVVPILDVVHFNLAFVILLVLITYILDKKFGKLFDNYILLFSIVIVIMISGINNVYSYFSSYRIQSGIYKNIPVTLRLRGNVENVSQFILKESKEHNVYIADFTSPLYNLNINRYTKYFDLFMNGNFGVSGEKEIYNIIDEKNQIILIDRRESNWQCPKRIINYVKNNYNKCGMINQFDIYCN